MFNIKESIKREMKKRHLSLSELSRRTGTKPASVHSMLNRKTLQVGKLEEISNALKYNFFREIAEQFPFEKPVLKGPFEQKEIELNKEISRLQKELSGLSEENKTLKTKLEVYQSVIEKIGPTK